METGIFRRGDQISLWLMLVILTGVLIGRCIDWQGAKSEHEWPDLLRF